MDACVAPLQVLQLLPTHVLIRLTSNLKSVIGLCCCVVDDELMTFPPKRSSPVTLGLLKFRHVFVLMQLFRSCSTDFVQSHNLNTETGLPCCVIITSAKQLMLQSSDCKPANLSVQHKTSLYDYCLTDCWIYDIVSWSWRVNFAILKSSRSWGLLEVFKMARTNPSICCACVFGFVLDFSWCCVLIAPKLTQQQQQQQQQKKKITCCWTACVLSAECVGHVFSVTISTEASSFPSGSGDHGHFLPDPLALEPPLDILA